MIVFWLGEHFRSTVSTWRSSVTVVWWICSKYPTPASTSSPFARQYFIESLPQKPEAASRRRRLPAPLSCPFHNSFYSIRKKWETAARIQRSAVKRSLYFSDSGLWCIIVQVHSWLSAFLKIQRTNKRDISDTGPLRRCGSWTNFGDREFFAAGPWI